MAIELYRHNKVAYENVRRMLEEKNKACIVHATGTGKSFIALSLIYDFLKENPDCKITYLAPLNGIFKQIREHIETFDLPSDTFNNVEFINYSGLVSTPREELESIRTDLFVFDEFHHIGAPEWTKLLNILLNNNPEAMIFGMSATSVRGFGTKYEEDVAETFFEGNVASRYDLAQAINDDTLPQPNYHTALTVLEGDVAELERKIESKNATDEEKEKYKKILANIKSQIASGNLGETEDQIIKKYIKPTGKYIYFCPKGANIQELQENIIAEMSEECKNNIEIYQVHSSEQSDKLNQTQADNFYHNKTADGQDASGKLRIMFAIDMYNEGIHVPDIDGVIMGRATKSDIIFYQQLGRALAVKKKNEQDIVDSPLVIDLMGNLKEIKRLYMRVESLRRLKTREKDDRDTPRVGNSSSQDDEFLAKFGLTDEIIDLLNTLEEIKSFTDFKLGDEERIKALADYVSKNGNIPSWNDKETSFSDGANMRNWLTVNKQKIIESANSGNRDAMVIVEQFRMQPEEIFQTKLEEALTYCKTNKRMPKWNESDVTFSDGAPIYAWMKTYKTRISEEAHKGNISAKKLFGYFAITQEEAFTLHIEEMFDFIQTNGGLPKKSNNERFSDGGLMAAWLNKNKKKIAQRAQEGNEKAKVIAEHQQMNSKSKEGKGLRTVDRIKEILEYYDKNGKLPTDSDGVKFQSGADMSLWLGSQPNKEAIQELLSQNNPEAIRLIQIQNSLSYEGIFERKLQEIYQYLKENDGYIKSDGSLRFSDGSDMYSWTLSSKNKLVELATSGSEIAQFIIERQYGEKFHTWSTRSKNPIKKEEEYEIHIQEIISYVKEHESLPKSTEKVRFSDGKNLIISWINDNKKNIQEKAEMGDELSKIAYDIIYRNSEQGKFEIHTAELIKHYQEYGILPTKLKDATFEDSGSMYNFICNKAKKIYEQRETLPIVAELAEIILANNPKYFDRVIRFRKAKEEFDDVSLFEGVDKQKKEAKLGNGK